MLAENKLDIKKWLMQSKASVEDNGYVYVDQSSTPDWRHQWLIVQTKDAVDPPPMTSDPGNPWLYSGRRCGSHQLFTAFDAMCREHSSPMFWLHRDSRRIFSARSQITVPCSVPTGRVDADAPSLCNYTTFCDYRNTANAACSHNPQTSDANSEAEEKKHETHRTRNDSIEVLHTSEEAGWLSVYHDRDFTTSNDHDIESDHLDEPVIMSVVDMCEDVQPPFSMLTPACPALVVDITTTTTNAATSPNNHITTNAATSPTNHTTTNAATSHITPTTTNIATSQITPNTINAATSPTIHTTTNAATSPTNHTTTNAATSPTNHTTTNAATSPTNHTTTNAATSPTTPIHNDGTFFTLASPASPNNS